MSCRSDETWEMLLPGQLSPINTKHFVAGSINQLKTEIYGDNDAKRYDAATSG